MRKAKREKLEKLGYRVTDTKEFLGLTDEEMALIELKINLIKKLREVRRTNRVTQKQLAKLMKSSQSRVAMLEANSSDVSLDLVCKALFALGVSSKELGKTVAGKRAA